MENVQLKSSFIGGTILTTVANIKLDDILFSIIMAVVGAVVSFFVTLLLRKIFLK